MADLARAALPAALLALGLHFSPALPAPDRPPALSPREAMRSFVIAISAHAKRLKPDFQIITQNGNELFGSEPGARLSAAYADAVDAAAQESLWFGGPGLNSPTVRAEREWLAGLLRAIRSRGKPVLVTDYCDRPELAAEALARNAAEGFLSYPAPSRGLNGLPPPAPAPPGRNAARMRSVRDARNFFYFINPDPSRYPTRPELAAALAGLPHDLFILDLFLDGEALTPADLAAMRRKPQGGERLLIAYLSIGEAEDYRWYWRPAWKEKPPAWLDAENPDWKGNYRVRYWEEEWQTLIFGSRGSYLERIVAAGFDGAYLDTIDSYEYYEKNAIPSARD